MKREAVELLRKHGYKAFQIMEINHLLKKDKYVAIYHRYGEHSYESFKKYENARNMLYYGSEGNELFSIALLSKNRIEWKTNYCD